MNYCTIVFFSSIAVFVVFGRSCCSSINYLIFILRCDADQDILDASSANVRQLQSKTSTKLKAGVSNRNVCDALL